MTNCEKWTTAGQPKQTSINQREWTSTRHIESNFGRAAKNGPWPEYRSRATASDTATY